MPRKTPPQFRKNLLAWAACAAFAPQGAWALALVQEPPLPTARSAFVAPNVIISLDDSGSMNFCLNAESATECTKEKEDNSKMYCTTTNTSIKNCQSNKLSCYSPYKMDSEGNCSIWTGANNNTTPNADGTWSIYSRRVNVLKYALKKVFNNEDILPKSKNSIRIAWQTMNGGGNVTSDEKNVNSATMKVNSMRPINTVISKDSKGNPTATHRDKFLTFVDNLTPGSSTPSHRMFSQADAYMRNDPSQNGPWSTNPGGTDLASKEYLGCRRNYHIMMTDGRWNGTATAVPDANKRDNATNLTLGDNKTIYTGSDSALYRDTSTGTTLADWAFYSWAVPLVSTSKLSEADKLKPPATYNDAPATETFGSGTNAVTLKKVWNPKYNPATWPHMVTYTIGFSQMAYSWDYASIKAPSEMVPFGYDGSFPALAKGTTTWPNLTTSTESRNALDLWHAALNGRGRFYAIEKGEDLEKAFNEIIGKVIEESAPLPDKINGGASTSGYNISITNAGYFSSVYSPKDGWKGWVSASPAGVPKEIPCPDDATKTCLDDPSADWKGKTTADLLDALTSLDNRLILSWNDQTKKGVPFKWDTDEANLSSAQKALLGKETSATTVVAEKGENVLKYIRGDRGLEGSEETGYPDAKPFRQRQSRQGDIVNSEIWYTGAPVSNYAVNNYSTFAKTHKARTPMIYVGGNDGMLHGFSAKDGSEKIAYVPRGVISQLKNLTDPLYKHQYFVDGSPMTGDVFQSSGWATVLIGTLGAGGKGYFVLNVTDPGTFSSALPADLVQMDRTRGNGESCDTLTGTDKADCEDIGNITAQPVRYSSNLQQSTQITRMNNGRWAVVMGNGYNSTNQRPVLLVQYLSGEDRKLIRIPATGEAAGTGNAKDNGLAAPALVDLNNDGRTDVVYAGDNLGNLWKFDLTSDDDSKWGVAFSSKPLFTALGPISLNGTRDQVQPITAPPIVRANDEKMTVGTGNDAKTVAVGGMMVAFGTGRNLTEDDRSTQKTQNVQTLYSVLDNTRYLKDGDHLKVHKGPYEDDCTKADAPTPCVPEPASEIPITKLAQQKFEALGNDYATLKPVKKLDRTNWVKTYMGWYVDFPENGERLLKAMQFYDGTNLLAVSSEAPAGTRTTNTSNQNESCSPAVVATSAGTQFLSFINIMNGTRPSFEVVLNPPTGLPPDDPVTRVPTPTGTPLLIKENGKTIDKTNCKENCQEYAPPPEKSLRPSWRQLK